MYIHIYTHKYIGVEIKEYPHASTPGAKLALRALTYLTY
jgi:hypothetical protein